MGSNTPLMKQYQSIKKQYPDCLLFFRLGDFYELFGEDAVKAAKELDIVLTSRGLGKNAKVPMCGVPYHAAENYLNRLLEKGYKVAICEQLEEAKPGKGIVKRDVVRVATPGTVLNPEYLDQSSNNYIISLYQKKDKIGCAWSDISTAEFQLAQFYEPEATEYLLDLVNRLQPTECIVAKGQLAVFQSLLKDRWNKEVLYTEVDQAAEDLLIEQFGQENMVGLNQNAMQEGLTAAANLLVYLQETQKTDKLPFRKIEVYTPGSHMYLDAMTIRNLELFITLRDGKKEGSLLWALDRTLTGMGTRLLRRWLGLPLLDVAEIEKRQESVQELADNFFLRKDVRDRLNDVYDLERIISRIAWSAANPRDLLALAKSLSVIPHIKDSLKQAKSSLLQKLGNMLDPISELQQLIFKALVDDPPVNPKNGGIIRNGYNSEIDRLREMIDQGEDWIKRLELEERKRTGIKSLKIGFNKVFGYYIEVTKPNLHLVPDNYIRKQTLT
ncbi:MAG: DNA mismatch repair protein MutS, partial [Thermacetogeniaceae bacterium]